MPNVKEIVENYLRAEGFDGLCNADCECNCFLKNGPTIMICNDNICDKAGPIAACVPGHKVMGDDGDCVIKPGKPERKSIKEICNMPHADFSDLKKMLEEKGRIVKQGQKPDREWHEDVP